MSLLRAHLGLHILLTLLTLCAIAYALFAEDAGGALIGLIWLGIYGTGAWKSFQAARPAAPVAR